MGACAVQRISLNCIRSCEVKDQDLEVVSLEPWSSCLLSVLCPGASGLASFLEA